MKMRIVLAANLCLALLILGTGLTRSYGPQIALGDSFTLNLYQKP